MTRQLVLDLTKDEETILRYIIDGADSPYAGERYLKDTYELGNDEPKEPYTALATLAKKLREATPK